jgi:hypothetical protein
MENVDRNIEEQIRNWRDRTSPALDRRILGDLARRLPAAQSRRAIFTPAGIGRILMMNKRVKLAVAAVIALALMLPAGYAAVKAVVKYFTISEDRVSLEFRDANYAAGFAASRKISIGGTNLATEEEARAHLEEFRRLYREGKAKEIEPGVWQVTLANGETFNYAGDPERTTAAFSDEEKTRMQQEFEEIRELQKAGKGERTLLRETEENGVKIRLYQVRYTLFSGKVVTLTEGRSTQGGWSGGTVGGASQTAAGATLGEMPEFLKQQMAEIKALRQAGKGERTFLREVEQNGGKVNLYEVRYTLSDGRVVTVMESVNPDGSLAGMGMGGGMGGSLSGSGMGGGGSSGSSPR